MTSSKSLRLLLVFGACWIAAPLGGCLSETGSTGGQAARSLFVKGTDGSPASSFSGPSSPTGGSGDAPPEGAGLGDDPGTTSDTPITVVGSPLGSSNIPRCSPLGTTITFDPAETAITGMTDELGRNEILIKTHVYMKYPNLPAEPMSSKTVRFLNPDNEETYGTTAIASEGCVYARAYAPPSAVGRVVRLSASVFVCAPERPNVDNSSGTNASFKALTFGSQGFVEGTLDVTLPSETAEKTLAACDFVDILGPIRQDAAYQEILQRRLERRQQNDAGASDPSYRKSLILGPNF